MGVENAAQLGMVLRPCEQMESGLHFLGQTLGPVIARGDFEVQATNVSALVLVLDAEVRYNNLVVHKLEVVFAGELDSLVDWVLVRTDSTRLLLVELPFEFVVEDDSADLAADTVNLLGYFVVEPLEVGIMASFLSFDEAVVDRLSIWNQVLLRKKFVSFSREREHWLRVRLVPLDASLLDKSLSAKILNIALRPRAVTSITETPKVIGWNDAKLAHLD